MGNKINTNPVLVAKVLVLLQEPTIYEQFANTEYEGDLDAQWDTVKVQNFPIVNWNNVTSWTNAQDRAGNTISVTDWELGISEIKVDEVANINLKIKDIEKALSNLNLESGLQMAVVKWNRRLRSHTVRDALIAGAGLTVGSATTVATKENVLETFIYKATEALDEDYVEDDGRVLVARTDFLTLIKASDTFDATNIWAQMRKSGVVWEVDWYFVFKDNTLPAWVSIAFKNKAVHYIKKYLKIRIAGVESNHEGNWSNLIGEMVHKAKILEPNAKRVCKILYSFASAPVS